MLLEENKTAIENSKSKENEIKNNSSQVEEKKENTKVKSKEVLVNDSIVKFEDPFVAEQRFRRKSMDGMEEKIIQIRRVIKVTKGGRQFRFSALVVVGNKKGQVGFGTAKAKEVPEAIKKAIADAKKNLVQVRIDRSSDTVYHEWTGSSGAAKVKLMPAGKGKGLVVSDTVRAVVELAGFQNMYSKVVSKSNNKYNVIAATIDALASIKSGEYYDYLKSEKKSDPKFDRTPNLRAQQIKNQSRRPFKKRPYNGKNNKNNRFNSNSQRNTNGASNTK